MPGADPKISSWRSWSLKFGFRFHRQFAGELSSTNIAKVFSFLWSKSFRSRHQKLVDVGAGAKKIRCLELETEIWFPVP